MCGSLPRRSSQVDSAHERTVVGVRGTRNADRTENRTAVAEPLAAPFSHLNWTPGKVWKHLKGIGHRPDSPRGSGKNDNEMPATDDNETGSSPQPVEDDRFENHGSGGAIRRGDDAEQARQPGPGVDERNRAQRKGWTRDKGKRRRSVLLSAAPANTESRATEKAELDRCFGDYIGRREPPTSILSPFDDTCDQPEVKGKRQNELIRGQGVLTTDSCDRWDARAEALEVCGGVEYPW